jgi:hypothetical protein
VTRIVFTKAADEDAAFIFDDLYAKAGKPTVVKYRALFKKLYETWPTFPKAVRRAPESGDRYASASFPPSS